MNRLFTGIFIVFVLSFTPVFAHKDHLIEETYSPSLDVLFIIDNSESFYHLDIKGRGISVQDFLAENAGVFISHFSKVKFLDYHIGVTGSLSHRFYEDTYPMDSSVPVSPELRALVRCDDLAEKQGHGYSNYVERDTPKGDECLKEMMRIGQNGFFQESFLDVPFRLMSMVLFPLPSFYRPEAHLGLFTATDTDDQSDFLPEIAYDVLKLLKNQDERKLHYAIEMITTQWENCKSERGYDDLKWQPKKLMRMVELFGDRGYSFDLCQYNYEKDLTQFANHLIDSVLSIPLDQLPEVETIEIFYGNAKITMRTPSRDVIEEQVVELVRGSWAYDREANAIRLSRDLDLEAGGKFFIRYIAKDS